jgi:RNA polymerase sigma factor (sigma-70 family)
MNPQQEALFNANSDLASTIARGFPLPGESQQAAHQEALLGLQDAVLAFDPERGEFEPFAKKVIGNRLRSAYRAITSNWTKQTELHVARDEEDGRPPMDELADSEPSPSHEAERNEIRKALRESLQSITPTQQRILEHYANGGSFAEVARRANISEQAVRQMFNRGVRQIRPRLEARGVANSRLLPDVPENCRAVAEPILGKPSQRSSCSASLVIGLLLLAAALFALSKIFTVLR